MRSMVSPGKGTSAGLSGLGSQLKASAFAWSDPGCGIRTHPTSVPSPGSGRLAGPGLDLGSGHRCAHEVFHEEYGLTGQGNVCRALRLGQSAKSICVCVVRSWMWYSYAPNVSAQPWIRAAAMGGTERVALNKCIRGLWSV